MNITGLRKITLFNPDTGDVAQFNTVKAEGQLNLNQINADPDSTGGIPYAGDDSELSATLYDLGAPEDQVLLWRSDGARISAVGLGHQVNFLWLERDHAFYQRPYQFATGQRKRGSLSIKRTGGQHKIDHMMNLLHNDNLLDTPSSNVKRFPFPIEGAVLTLSRDFSAGDANITIKAISYDGVTVLQTVTGDGASPRTSAKIMLPASTYYVECDLGQAGGNPALRSDDSTEYIDE